ncbi:hypothetical protein D3C84_710040 [compost metagenome]
MLQWPVLVAHGKGEAYWRQSAGTDNLQSQIRTQGIVGPDDDLIADERIDLALVEGFQSTTEIGRQDHLALGVDPLHHLDIGIAVEQYNLLPGQ